MATQSPTSEQPTASQRVTEITLPAPVLLIAARSLAKVVPLVLALIVFAIALFNGTDPTTAGIRALITLAATAAISWLILSLLAQIIVRIVESAKPKPQPAPAPATSTQSWEA
jgi:hypothetical protein